LTNEQKQVVRRALIERSAQAWRDAPETFRVALGPLYTCDLSPHEIGLLGQALRHWQQANGHQSEDVRQAVDTRVLALTEALKAWPTALNGSDYGFLNSALIDYGRSTADAPHELANAVSDKLERAVHPRVERQWSIDQKRGD
jgi:hypothetical protein